MLRLAVLVACLLGAVSPAEARPRGVGVAGPSGSAQINIGLFDLVPGNFINIFKASQLTFTTAADAALLDSSGYLNGTPAGDVTITFPASGTMFTNTQYKLVWPATIQFGGLRFLTGITGCSATNATTSACAGAGTTITTTGGAGSVTFSTTAGSFSIRFLAGNSVSHSGGELALYRVSDEADYLAGEYFTPEFKALLTAMNPGTIRLMQWVQTGSGNFNGETNWNYRLKTSSFSWATRNIPSAAWAGSISGTDTYTVTAPDSKTIIGVIANANTVTNPTLNGIPILSAISVAAPSVGGISTGLATFTYDALLNVYLYNSNGFPSSVPIEAQVHLANRLRKHLWTNLPPWADDNYARNWATVVRDNLSNVLLFKPEYSNEVFNFAFPQTFWAIERGKALGFPNSNNRPYHGWYGLRARQVMGNIIPSVFAGQMSRVSRVMTYSTTNDTNIVPYRLKGSDLAPSGTSTGTGNAAYVALTGGADYTTIPNRPQDVVEINGYAPYTGGTNLCEGPDLNCTPTSANAPFYQSLVTAWEGGDQATAISLIDDDIRQGRILVQNVTCSGTTFTTPSAHGFTANTTAVAFQVTGGTMYSGISAGVAYRVTTTPSSTTFTMQGYAGGIASGANINCGSAGSGTTTVGALGTGGPNRSMITHANIYEQFGEAIAASFDGDRPVGMAPIRNELYEGNLEPQGLSAAQCTSLGITGADCAGSIAAALTAWKNDNKSSLTTQAYFNQFMGLDSSSPPTYGLMPHSKAPSWFVIECSVSYAMLSGCLPNSTPYKTFTGFQTYSSMPH